MVLRFDLYIFNYTTMSNKTNKSFMKRVKITSTGKIMKRPPGQNHFNAKDSGKRGRRKHGLLRAPTELGKKAKALILNYII